MTSLFFFLGIVFFLYEFIVFIKPQEEVERIKKFSNKEHFENKGERVPREVVGGCLFLTMHLTYMLWTFIGVAFASQWKSFLILIIVGLVSAVTSTILKKLKLDNTILKPATKLVDGLVCSVVIADIYLVHFQNVSPGLVTTFLTWF